MAIVHAADLDGVVNLRLREEDGFDPSFTLDVFSGDCPIAWLLCTISFLRSLSLSLNDSISGAGLAFAFAAAVSDARSRSLRCWCLLNNTSARVGFGGSFGAVCFFGASLLTCRFLRPYVNKAVQNREMAVRSVPSLGAIEFKFFCCLSKPCTKVRKEDVKQVKPRT